jgi:hypothetical protein
MLFFYNKYQKSCSRSKSRKKEFPKLSYCNSRCEIKGNRYVIYSFCRKKNYHYPSSIELPRKLYD